MPSGPTQPPSAASSSTTAHTARSDLRKRNKMKLDPRDWAHNAEELNVKLKRKVRKASGLLDRRIADHTPSDRKTEITR